MSLYTPVFPPTDTPPEPTPSSSSLSSVEAQKHQRTQSYSSRLAQWHLAIASLPYELCPTSSPPSPGSQARSANLQSEIEKAVRNGRNITDFCKLRSTKLGYATKQPSHETLEQGERIPWILAETEEEWFQWEREVAQRRVGRKGKDRALNLPPPPATLSQIAHDKVLSWKAGLLPPSASPVTASPAPPGTANTVRSSLGFPVVKPSTLARRGISKPIKPTTQSDLASRPNPEARTDGDEVPVLRADSRIMTVDHADTNSVKHESAGIRPPSEANQDSLHADVESELPGPHDFSVFPTPSFPLDLVTSTQKDVIGTVHTKRDPSPLPPILPADETNEVIPDKLQESQVNCSSIPDDPDSSDKSSAEPTVKQIPQATPPSPPYSSETSQQQPQQPHVPPEAAVIRTSATPPLLDHVQPLTPPPETGIEDNGPVSNEMQSSPRTPEPPRRQPSGMKFFIASQADVLSGVSGIDKGKAIVTAAHTTPDAAINGASAVRGNLFPRTPERKQKVLSDPLTTSRKSRPRPRPPSRKRSVHNVNMDLDGGVSEVDDGEVDPSPTKSERSYFSSPASGSSSDSGFSRGSLLFVPGSPTSPLGGFTQQPSRFAPLAHSTQISSKRPSSPTPLHSRSKSRGKSQSQSQRGVYDSQFDVDARVDQVSNFMRQDVDLDAWIRATDTEADDEDDDFAVEEMTRAPISSIGSR